MAFGKPLHLRLFLEGLEVPVISASVSINKNAPAACAVQVVPLDQVLDLKPRTMVHVFFLDTQVSKNVDGSFQNVDHSYRLLFTGEVVGFSMVMTPASRAVILQCVDFSSYWDSAHAMAIEYGANGNAFTNHGSLHGGAVGTFDDIVNTQPEVISRLFRQKPDTPGLNGISGVAGGIINIMELVGGTYPHKKGINDFFTFSELRCRLMAQIAAEENDSTSSRVLSGTVFDQWLRNGLQNMGQQVTFRDMMLLLMRYIYYDFVPNPTARYTPSIKGTEKKTASRVYNISAAPSALRAKKLLQESLPLLTDVGDEEGEGTITTAKVVGKKIKDAAALLKGLGASSKEFAGTVVTINERLLKAQASLEASLKGSKIPSTVATAIQSAISAVDSSTVKVFDGGSNLRIGASDQRLRAHIFRPDCWFAPAPMCNVIFPEQFSQVSYDRNFMSEVTRLYVSSFSTIVGSDELLNARTLIPNHIVNTERLAKAQGVNSYRVLLEHEYHTGVIPRSEWIPNTSAIGSRGDAVKTANKDRIKWTDRIGLFHFFKYRYGPRQVAVAGRFNPFVVAGFPGVIIQRPFTLSTSDTEDLQRWMQTKHPSNSALLDYIQTNADKLKAPAQLVGSIESVQHNVSQEGGSSLVSMSHARTHLGVDDEFLSTLLTQSKGKKKTITQTTLTYASVRNSPTLLKMLADLTPQTTPASVTSSILQRSTVKVPFVATKESAVPGGAPTSVSTFVSAIVDSPVATSSPPTTRQNLSVVERTNVLVPSPSGRLTVGGKGRLGGKIIAVEVRDDQLIQDPKVGRVFASVTVYEEVEVPLTLHLPVEQIAKPAWFSPSFSNQNIGPKIYQPIFGCDSIVDGINASGLDLTSDTGGAGEVVSADLPVDQAIQQLITQESDKAALTVERAVNLIGYLYGQVRSQAADVDDFIRQFNNRPIATLTEMLGENLDFDVSTDPATPIPQDASRPFVVGFHSSATNRRLIEKGGLAGLYTGVGKTEPVSPVFDVRLAKWEKVAAYVAAFTAPRAFRG